MQAISSEMRANLGKLEAAALGRKQAQMALVVSRRVMTERPSLVRRRNEKRY